MIGVSRLLLQTAAMLALASELSAQPPAVDPQRAVVERADEVAKALEDPQISDPTVFVKSAALGEITQMELAKLAQSKSQDPNIRAFADRMLKDHDAIRAELSKIAKRKRLDVPTSLIYQDEQMLAEAAEKTGAQFDAWYARQMLQEHDKSIALFRGTANMEDAELSAFAKKTLPTLNEHYRMALGLSSTPAP